MARALNHDKVSRATRGANARVESRVENYENSSAGGDPELVGMLETILENTPEAFPGWRERTTTLLRIAREKGCIYSNTRRSIARAFDYLRKCKARGIPFMQPWQSDHDATGAAANRQHHADEKWAKRPAWMRDPSLLPKRPPGMK